MLVYVKRNKKKMPRRTYFNCYKCDAPCVAEDGCHLHKPKMKEYFLNYYNQHQQEMIDRSRNYYENNKDKVKLRVKEYQRKRYHELKQLKATQQAEQQAPNQTEQVEQTEQVQQQ